MSFSNVRVATTATTTATAAKQQENSQQPMDICIFHDGANMRFFDRDPIIVYNSLMEVILQVVKGKWGAEVGHVDYFLCLPPNAVRHGVRLPDGTSAADIPQVYYPQEIKGMETLDAYGAMRLVSRKKPGDDDQTMHKILEREERIAEMRKVAYGHGGIFVLVSGDGDFLRHVRKLKLIGCRVIVIHNRNCHPGLRNAADYHTDAWVTLPSTREESLLAKFHEENKFYVIPSYDKHSKEASVTFVVRPNRINFDIWEQKAVARFSVQFNPKKAEATICAFFPSLSQLSGNNDKEWRDIRGASDVAQGVTFSRASASVDFLYFLSERQLWLPKESVILLMGKVIAFMSHKNLEEVEFPCRAAKADYWSLTGQLGLATPPSCTLTTAGANIQTTIDCEAKRVISSRSKADVSQEKLVERINNLQTQLKVSDANVAEMKGVHVKENKTYDLCSRWKVERSPSGHRYYSSRSLNERREHIYVARQLLKEALDALQELQYEESGQKMTEEHLLRLHQILRWIHAYCEARLPQDKKEEHGSENETRPVQVKKKESMMITCQEFSTNGIDSNALRHMYALVKQVKHIVLCNSHGKALYLCDPHAEEDLKYLEPSMPPEMRDGYNRHVGGAEANREELQRLNVIRSYFDEMLTKTFALLHYFVLMSGAADLECMRTVRHNITQWLMYMVTLKNLPGMENIPAERVVHATTVIHSSLLLAMCQDLTEMVQQMPSGSQRDRIDACVREVFLTHATYRPTDQSGADVYNIKGFRSKDRDDILDEMRRTTEGTKNLMLKTITGQIFSKLEILSEKNGCDLLSPLVPILSVILCMDAKCANPILRDAEFCREMLEQGPGYTRAVLWKLKEVIDIAYEEKSIIKQQGIGNLWKSWKPCITMATWEKDIVGKNERDGRNFKGRRALSAVKDTYLPKLEFFSNVQLFSQQIRREKEKRENNGPFQIPYIGLFLRFQAPTKNASMIVEESRIFRENLPGPDHLASVVAPDFDLRSVLRPGREGGCTAEDVKGMLRVLNAERVRMAMQWEGWGRINRERRSNEDITDVWMTVRKMVPFLPGEVHRMPDGMEVDLFGTSNKSVISMTSDVPSVQKADKQGKERSQGILGWKDIEAILEAMQSWYDDLEKRLEMKGNQGGPGDVLAKGPEHRKSVLLRGPSEAIDRYKQVANMENQESEQALIKVLCELASSTVIWILLETGMALWEDRMHSYPEKMTETETAVYVVSDKRLDEEANRCSVPWFPKEWKEAITHKHRGDGLYIHPILVWKLLRASQVKGNSEGLWTGPVDSKVRYFHKVIQPRHGRILLQIVKDAANQDLEGDLCTIIGQPRLVRWAMTQVNNSRIAAETIFQQLALAMHLLVLRDGAAKIKRENPFADSQAVFVPKSMEIEEGGKKEKSEHRQNDDYPEQLWSAGSMEEARQNMIKEFQLCALQLYTQYFHADETTGRKGIEVPFAQGNDAKMRIITTLMDHLLAVNPMGVHKQLEEACKQEDPIKKSVREHRHAELRCIRDILQFVVTKWNPTEGNDAPLGVFPVPYGFGKGTNTKMTHEWQEEVKRFYGAIVETSPPYVVGPLLSGLCHGETKSTGIDKAMERATNLLFIWAGEVAERTMERWMEKNKVDASEITSTHGRNTEAQSSPTVPLYAGKNQTKETAEGKQYAKELHEKTHTKEALAYHVIIDMRPYAEPVEYVLWCEEYRKVSGQEPAQRKNSVQFLKYKLFASAVNEIVRKVMVTTDVTTVADIVEYASRIIANEAEHVPMAKQYEFFGDAVLALMLRTSNGINNVKEVLERNKGGEWDWTNLENDIGLFEYSVGSRVLSSKKQEVTKQEETLFIECRPDLEQGVEGNLYGLHCFRHALPDENDVLPVEQLMEDRLPTNFGLPVHKLGAYEGKHEDVKGFAPFLCKSGGEQKVLTYLTPQSILNRCMARAIAIPVGVHEEEIKRSLERERVRHVLASLYLEIAHLNIVIWHTETMMNEHVKATLQNESRFVDHHTMVQGTAVLVQDTEEDLESQKQQSEKREAIKKSIYNALVKFRAVLKHILRFPLVWKLLFTGGDRRTVTKYDGIRSDRTITYICDNFQKFRMGIGYIPDIVKLLKGYRPSEIEIAAIIASLSSTNMKLEIHSVRTPFSMWSIPSSEHVIQLIPVMKAVDPSTAEYPPHTWREATPVSSKGAVQDHVKMLMDILNDPEAQHLNRNRVNNVTKDNHLTSHEGWSREWTDYWLEKRTAHLIVNSASCIEMQEIGGSVITQMVHRALVVLWKMWNAWPTPTESQKTAGFDQNGWVAEKKEADWVGKLLGAFAAMQSGVLYFKKGNEPFKDIQLLLAGMQWTQVWLTWKAKEEQEKRGNALRVWEEIVRPLTIPPSVVWPKKGQVNDVWKALLAYVHCIETGFIF